MMVMVVVVAETIDMVVMVGAMEMVVVVGEMEIFLCLTKKEKKKSEVRVKG